MKFEVAGIFCGLEVEKVMKCAILVVLLVICAIGWLTRAVSCASLFWYLQKKGYDFPTEKDMKDGCEWAAKHFISDLFQKKNRN